MDIKPVDVQMFINKSSQINKNENQEQKGNEQFQFFAETFKKTNQEKNQKTIETNKSEDSQVNKDGKNQNQKQKNNKQKNNKTLNNKNSNKKQSQSLFNVCI